MALSIATSCKKDPPAPPPDPNAWVAQSAKLTPFLPPVLGPCTSIASAQTMHSPQPKDGSEYEATRSYDCGGSAMIVTLHAGNTTSYATQLDGRHSNFGSDSMTTYKDVMIGGGHGVHMSSAGAGALTLLLPKQIVVTAKLDHPSPPDALIPIMNKLDFKGLSTIDPQQVP
jgi:hypothetical protein